MASFGDASPVPAPGDDDHALWYKVALGAGNYAISQGQSIPLPLNQYDDHQLLFLASQAFYNLAHP